METQKLNEQNVINNETQTEFETKLLKYKGCEFILPIHDNFQNQFILESLDDDEMILEGSIGFQGQKANFSDNIHLCVFRNTEFNNVDYLTDKHISEIINQYVFWKEGDRSRGNQANTVTIYTNLAIEKHSSEIKDLEKYSGLKIERISAPYF